MPFYLLSFHFPSFMQVERFSGRNTTKCFSKFGFKILQIKPQTRRQRGTPQEPKKGSKVCFFFLTDVRKKQQRDFIFFPDARQQRFCHQKKKLDHTNTKRKTHAPYLFLKIRNDGIHAFSIVFFTRSCPCTCNSCLIFGIRSFFGGSELKDVIIKKKKCYS